MLTGRKDPNGPSGNEAAAPPSGLLARLPAPIKLVTGFVLLFAGAALAIPGIPGPGIPIMVLGLLLLSERYHWARRVLAWGRAQVERIRRKRRG